MAQEEIEILLHGVGRGSVQTSAANPSDEGVWGDRVRGDKDFDLTIELGSAQLQRDEALALTAGSVVALDKLISDSVEVWINGRLTARGEVVVMNEKLCVRLLEIVEGELAKAG